MALSNMEKISALSREGRRRGMNYGHLAAALTKEEQEKLFKRYEREKKGEQAKKK